MPLSVAITVILSTVFLAPVRDVGAEVLCEPQIGVQLNLNEIRAWCFQSEATVTLTIDDPGTAQNPDYSASGMVPIGDYPMVIFHYELESGYIIEASDGMTTRQLIFQPVGISDIDTQANTVSGTAIPLSQVVLSVRLLSNTWVSRGAFSDATGKWMANFNDPNYSGGAVDLQNGMLIDVTQYDSDFDGVTYERRILPRVNVNVERSSYESFGWAENVLVTLEVDDPANETSPDCTYTETAWRDSVNMSLYQTGCSVKAGDIVTIKGNGVSTSHEVRLLEITRVDVINDVIRGIAAKEQRVLLDLWLGGNEIMAETISDADGNWEFDFSTMIPPVDLVLEDDDGYVYIEDENGNSTVAVFKLDVPNMVVILDTNTVYGYNFQLGDTVTLTIDDPYTGMTPDFQTSLSVDDDEIMIAVDPMFPIKPGFVVKMFDSAYTRQLVVMDHSITSVDLANDQVYGRTSLTGSVWVLIFGPLPERTYLGDRYVSTDENGNWTAYFGDPNADPWGDGGTVDIQPGYVIETSQQDDDFDLLINNDWVIQDSSIPILDNFNRLDGPLGSNWLGYKNAYRILGNQVDVRGNGPIYWKDAFGVDQEVAVTLTTVDPAGKEQDLLLKVQGQYGPNWGEGAIEILYDAKSGTVAVWTFRLDSLEWFEYPALPVTFADGDQFGAQALSTGDVVIYKNGMEVGRVTLNPADQAFFNTKGGYVGLWFIDARSAFFDDFGGGNIVLP